jgi:flagellar biosynthesis/type III secretory pathway protein FliH
MKYLALLMAPLFVAGCLTADDVMMLANNPSQPGGIRPAPNSAAFYQNAFRDGYRQGYNAGFYDGGRGLPYRAEARYGGSAYNAPFADGYYKGYAEGFHEGRRGMSFGCSL